MAELWGGETRKAVENFPVSGERIPPAVIHWLGRIKGAAARVNADLGLLDQELAERIGAAADEVAAGGHDDQFPIDVFQTGSGTSSNMNANEVIATLAGRRRIPTTTSTWASRRTTSSRPPSTWRRSTAPSTSCCRRSTSWRRRSPPRPTSSPTWSRSGRTHLMDAVPVTLGQEFSGYAAQVREGHRRVRGDARGLGQIPLGGTAVGTGLNTHPEFAARVRDRLAADTGLPILPPADPFEAQANRDGLVEASGALKAVAVSLTKIANDLRWMGSGPRAGLAEIIIPELQKGSSIMPGKVNPVIPEVVCQVVGAGDRKRHRDHRRRTAGQLRAERPDSADGAQPAPVDHAAGGRRAGSSPSKCVDGIQANEAACARAGEATLAIATALNPFIGYDRATEIVKEAADSGRPLREVARDHGVEESVLDQALDLRRIAAGNSTAGAER